MQASTGRGYAAPVLEPAAVAGDRVVGFGVTMDWTPIGNPGNGCDPQSDDCYGAIGYAYSIGTYEVTNAQYAEFLNAVAAADTYVLYNPSMDLAVLDGGIHRAGTAGAYSYSAIAGRENLPVNYVSYSDALRFANWLHNGQPVGAQNAGTTEHGAYTLNGLEEAHRNASATIVLASENEWYKAAYYDSAVGHYWDYPTGTDSMPGCRPPTALPNWANCDAFGTDVADVDIDHPTPVGSFSGSPSPYGTFDQGGNLVDLALFRRTPFGA